MTVRTETTEHPVNLNFSSHGESGLPELLVLHGLFGSLTNWRSIIGALQPDFRITAVDLRNHGDSPWHSIMDYAAMAEDVAWLIEQYGIRKPSLLGHSMGGKVAMSVVQLGLTEIDRLIVADIAPVAYQHSHLGYVDAMQEVELADARSRSQVDDQLAGHIPESGIRQFLLQNLVREDDQYSWRINLPAIRSNMPLLLDYPDHPASEVETLFIGGANSSYISDAAYPEIVRQFPASRIETIADAGHWLHAEQPEQVVQHTSRFLLSTG